MDEELKRKNQRVLMLVIGVIIGMGFFTYGYQKNFHKICGLVGLPYNQGKSLQALLKTSERAGKDQSLVSFMGVSGQVPVDIEPLQREKWVKTGKITTVYYRLTNLTDHRVDFKAEHMTIPLTPDFQLIKCFCSTHHVLAPHETRTYPLTFSLTNTITSDAGLTINYTIFPYDGPGAVTQLSKR
ncbi:MAG TPA: cytochrome c oxidase assembly protein [Oscillatoriaceae cyanobacterium]